MNEFQQSEGPAAILSLHRLNATADEPQPLVILTPKRLLTAVVLWPFVLL